MTCDEKKTVESLLRFSTTQAQGTSTDNFAFAERFLKRRRISQSSGDKRYVHLHFILPTSNICERLFTKAGYALSDRRKGISPSRFESQIFCTSIMIIGH